jgi:CheY-like chemotaxis protein
MPFQRKRIRIVDNNEGEWQVLASMLERADYLPTTTWSGLEALELLKARELDLWSVAISPICTWETFSKGSSIWL